MIQFPGRSRFKRQGLRTAHDSNSALPATYTTGNTEGHSGNLPGARLPGQLAAPPVLVFCGQPTATEVGISLAATALWMLGACLHRRRRQA